MPGAARTPVACALLRWPGRSTVCLHSPPVAAGGSVEGTNVHSGCGHSPPSAPICTARSARHRLFRSAPCRAAHHATGRSFTKWWIRTRPRPKGRTNPHTGWQAGERLPRSGASVAEFVAHAAGVGHPLARTIPRPRLLTPRRLLPHRGTYCCRDEGAATAEWVDLPRGAGSCRADLIGGRNPGYDSTGRLCAGTLLPLQAVDRGGNERALLLLALSTVYRTLHRLLRSAPFADTLLPLQAVHRVRNERALRLPHGPRCCTVRHSGCRHSPPVAALCTVC